MENVFYDPFLGPQAENQMLLRNAICQIVDWHAAWRRKFYVDDGSIYPTRYNTSEHFHTILEDFLKRLEKQPPYFSPRYAAQMLKDPSLPAILGYLATMLTNPNNHAYEGGPVTTEMELDVVDDLLRLCGYRKGWGHLCSGGSLANLEAMWAVREIWQQKTRKPGQVLFSDASHYSWKRICGILRVDAWHEVRSTPDFRIDLDHLVKCLKKEKTMMVVANIGTTGCGAVDDLEALLELRNKYGFHLHADAAYGGYARSILFNRSHKYRPYEQVKEVLRKDVYGGLKNVERTDSITIDPHKHGAVAYGCGAVLYKEERLRKAILNTAPYTYHITKSANLGMFSLEGSRPGATAASVWLTHRMIPLNEEGYGRILSECLLTARQFAARLKSETPFKPLHEPDLDIVCFYPTAKPGRKGSLREMNARSENVYAHLSVSNPRSPFMLSKFILDPAGIAKPLGFRKDDKFLSALRIVFMKHWMRMGSPSYVDKLIQALLQN